MKYNNISDFATADIFGIGMPNEAFAQFFVGDSFLKPLTDKNCSLHISNVTFSPACRNHWHIHNAAKNGGQILICTTGEGWYQEDGKEAVSLTPGTIIQIPAGVKHWHGAKKDSWFSHIAIAIPGENESTEWIEPVEDEAYEALS